MRIVTGERRSTIVAMPFIISSFFTNLLHTKYIMTPLNFPVVFFFCLYGLDFFLSTLTNESNFHGILGLTQCPVCLTLTKYTKTHFNIPTDAHYHKIIEMLKQYKNYNTCSDTFRFRQEPSSGSSPVIS
jgi:hypothetical protein